VAVTLFRAPIEAYGARTINLAKCLLATLLQGMTVWVLGQVGALWTAPGQGLLLLAVSGVVGLTLGDTALFAAVRRIGVHRALLLQTLAPVFAALLAAFWPGERWTLIQAAGGVLTLAGVALVVAPARKAMGTAAGNPPASGGGRGIARAIAFGGVTLGVLSALGQGVGVVLAKVGMEEIPVLPASFFRLGAAALGLVFLGVVRGDLGHLVEVARGTLGWRRVVPATLVGTYLALFLATAGIAWAPAGLAAVLLATPPVFSLVIEVVWERKRPSPRGVAGTLVAVAGVGVLSAF
jgi:drug/metabolite transporter (DMT)-like permease